MSNKKKLYTCLTYAGAIPFLLCTLLLVFKVQVIPVLGSVQTIISIYGLVIASFMNGAHWGQHLRLTDKWSVYLPVTSNINAILLWLSYLMLPFKGFLIVLTVIFTVLLLIDKNLFQANIITQPYYQIRCVITLIVVISLTISGMCSW